MVKINGKTASKTKNGLTQKQERFCKLFVIGDKEFFGNGTQCYIQVYKKKGKKISYQSANASASRMLLNVNIIKRVNELLKTEGFTDENVDKQHLFLINQYGDLKTKLGAIKEFNTLKKRIDSPTFNITLPDILLEQMKERANHGKNTKSDSKDN